MAVVAMWKCDRDDAMFDNRKDADAHDRMLELAENFSLFLGKHSTGLSEQEAENIGLLLSRNKDILMAACKGNPELLLEIGGDGAQQASNVTALAAKA
ncbi:MAG: YebG family protein [Pseudomonadales bacterium]|nr:YebG family protein [Halioglobus sp.]MCP5194985.1 YebG family protein [Pseudomonadales bacterium]